MIMLSRSGYIYMFLFWIVVLPGYGQDTLATFLTQ